MTAITAPNATVYDQVYACSSPLIYHYRQDLETHDKDWIESNPGVPFIHMTRSTGTQLIPLYPHDHKGWPKAGENVSWLFGHTDRFGVLVCVLPRHPTATGCYRKAAATSCDHRRRRQSTKGR